MEYLPLLLLVLVFWLLVLRPQRRRAAEQARLHASLEVGQEVVTAGGLYGRIDHVGEDEVRLEIAPGTTVRIDKRAVAARVDATAQRADSG